MKEKDTVVCAAGTRFFQAIGEPPTSENVLENIADAICTGSVSSLTRAVDSFLSSSHDELRRLKASYPEMWELCLEASSYLREDSRSYATVLSAYTEKAQHISKEAEAVASDTDASASKDVHTWLQSWAKALGEKNVSAMLRAYQHIVALEGDHVYAVFQSDEHCRAAVLCTKTLKFLSTSTSSSEDASVFTKMLCELVQNCTFADSRRKALAAVYEALLIHSDWSVTYPAYLHLLKSPKEKAASSLDEEVTEHLTDTHSTTVVLPDVANQWMEDTLRTLQTPGIPYTHRSSMRKVLRARLPTQSGACGRVGFFLCCCRARMPCTSERRMRPHCL